MAAFLSVGKVAEIFDVDPGTVRYWCTEGRIEYIITPGGHRRISQESIDKFRYPADDYHLTLEKEQIQLDNLKKQVQDAKIEQMRLQQARLRKRLAKLKSIPNKDEQIRKMLEDGAPYSQIELALTTSPNRISRVAKQMKAMKMEVRA